MNIIIIHTILVITIIVITLFIGHGIKSPTKENKT